MSEELKPCPFCGKRNTLKVVSAYEMNEYEFSKNDRAICCNFKDGGCGAHSGYRGTIEACFENWNNRHDEIAKQQRRNDEL